MEHPVKFTLHFLLFIFLVVLLIKLYPCFRSPSGFLICAKNGLFGSLHLLCKSVGIKNNKVCDAAGTAFAAYQLQKMASNVKDRVLRRKLKAEKDAKDAGKSSEEIEKAGEDEFNKAKPEEIGNELKGSSPEEISSAAEASGEGAVEGLVADGVVATAEEGAVVATASSVEAAVGTVGAAAGPETAGLSIVAAVAIVGVTIATEKLTKWVSKTWKYCPCGWTYSDLVLPICYKGTCADEFGEGYREAKGSSGSACIKCPPGYINMGLYCGKGLKTASNHYKIRKTHTALIHKPNCGDNNKLSFLYNKYVNYGGLSIILLIFILLFILIVRNVAKSV